MYQLENLLYPPRLDHPMNGQGPKLTNQSRPKISPIDLKWMVQLIQPVRWHEPDSAVTRNTKELISLEKCRQESSKRRRRSWIEVRDEKRRRRRISLLFYKADAMFREKEINQGSCQLTTAWHGSCCCSPTCDAQQERWAREWVWTGTIFWCIALRRVACHFKQRNTMPSPEKRKEMESQPMSTTNEWCRREVCWRWFEINQWSSSERAVGQFVLRSQLKSGPVTSTWHEGKHLVF